MTDKESYVNVADLKRKLRAFAKYRQYSKPATDELLGVVSKLKISIKADLETTLESTDVQLVKHGRWESSQRTIETGTVYCSNCAIEYYISDLQTVGDCNGIVHYCPNCGARMDGDNNA